MAYPTENPKTADPAKKLKDDGAFQTEPKRGALNN